MLLLGSEYCDIGLIGYEIRISSLTAKNACLRHISIFISEPA